MRTWGSERLAGVGVVLTAVATAALAVLVVVAVLRSQR